MKKSITILIVVFITAILWAQSPEKMSYQAVVRNSSNELVANSGIKMKISILQGSASGTVVYTETQTPTTNANGLVSIEIGGGAGFSAINWANGPYFIKTEIDPTGGTNYTITATSQLLSVPYALHAKTAEKITGPITETDPIFNLSIAYAITGTDTNKWNTAYNWGNHTAAGYLKSFTEIDPIYTSKFDVSGSSTGDLLKFNGTKYVKFTPNYLTNFTETDPVFKAWTKNYNDLTNKPDLTVYATKNMNNQNITNMANPVNAQDATTKEYVDQKLQLLTAALQGVQDADGNHYATVMIGDQVWMAENMKTTKYNNGTSIPLVTDQTAWSNLATPGFCWYNNDAANKSVYGGLYNGYAILTGNLCPTGWHIPTLSEFMVLKNYLIANGYNFDGSTSGNKIAKSMAATVRWTASTYAGSPGNVPSSNNSSGFSALPGGLRAYSGIFYYVGNEGYWWSSSISGTYGNIVSLNYASVGIVEPSGPVKSGVCVRCLKN